jgi:hypothetical protein
MWLKQHSVEAIMQYTYWLPLGSIWIHRLKHERTGGKLIQISIISAMTQWRLAVHVGCRAEPTDCGSCKKHTKLTPISPMSHESYSVLYHIVSQWSPDIPLCQIVHVGDSPNYRRDPSQNVIGRQFGRPRNGIFAVDDPASDITNTENNSDMKTDSAETILHQMAEVHDLLEMW